MHIILKLSCLILTKAIASDAFLVNNNLSSSTKPNFVHFLPSNVPSKSTQNPSFKRTRISSSEPLFQKRNDKENKHTESSRTDVEFSRRKILFSMLAASQATATMGAFASDLTSEASSTTIAITDDENKGVTSTPTISITNIIKPPLDTKKYEYYTLENGLRVLLCSDPSSNRAAAAMDVHVGATSDPADVSGLAHFNEHMLFLGTEKYPKEDEFTSFLSANGGFSNAFTDSENTVYYFDMDAESNSRIEEGFDRFGSFFSCPLFTASATGRELNAIESENTKNLQSDLFRSYQIEKSRVNSKHPFSKFFTGNKQTLLTDTKKKGLDLREELLKFSKEYYSSNQMTLAIIAPQSIDTLKTYVSKSFGDIPNRNEDKPEKKWQNVPPFLPGSSVIPAQGSKVLMVPVQDLRQATLTFPIVYSSEEEKKQLMSYKPNFYVAHLLGHEGPLSLASYLKQKGWINGLAASDNESLSDFETFEVTVDLTNKGLEKVDDIVEAVFSYIQMLKTDAIPDYTFDEVMGLVDLEWRFLTQTNPSNYATSLAQSMMKYDPTYIIAGPRRLALDGLQKDSSPRTSFPSNQERSETVQSTLDFVSKLTPENMYMTVTSKSFQGKTNRVEKWYGTEYSVEDISLTTLMKWKNCASAKSLGIGYPRPNIFIPTEAGLKIKNKIKKSSPDQLRDFDELIKPVTPPQPIRNDDRWKVYFKQDDRFGEPKAFLIFELLTSKVYSSAESAILAQLYQVAARDNLNEYAYDATLANLSYDIQVLPRGVRLTFGGYNDKLGNFALYIADKLSRDVKTVLPPNDDEFDRYVDEIQRGLAAFDVKQPYSHAIYYSSLAVQPLRFQYTNEELREALKKVTLTDLTKYVETLWSSGRGEALIQGNIDKKEALDLVNKVDRTLGFQTISDDDYPPRVKALRLPAVKMGMTPTKILISEPNAVNKNAVSQFVFQSVDPSEKSHVLIELLSAILEQPFYEDLRTKQQLGYIVSSGVKGLEETRTLSLITQSSVATASDLTKAISKFVDSFRETTLEPLTEGDVATFVKGLVDKKLEPDKKLAVEATRNWNEITSGRYQFDRIQREVGALLNLSKADLLLFWDEIVSPTSNTGRRVLVSEVVPQSGPASSKAPPRSTGYGKKGTETLVIGVDDMSRFREERDPYVALYTSEPAL